MIIAASASSFIARSDQWRREPKRWQELNRSTDENEHNLHPARKEYPERDCKHSGHYRGRPDLSVLALISALPSGRLTTGPILNPAGVCPIGKSPAPPTCTRLTGHNGSRPRRGGRDSWVGGPEDNPRQTENVPGIRMSLLRIFSGRNRYEPENF